MLVSFIANMTTLFAIAAFMERDPHTFDRLPGWLFCALIMIGLVVIDVAGRLGSDATMMALLVGGSVLTGVGYGYYWGSWAEYLGRMHPSRTSFYVPMAFLLTAALFLIISLSAEYESAPPLLLMLPLPVLSLVCLRRCHAEVPDGRYARTVDSKRYLTALASLVTLIVASLVLSLLFGLVWEMTVLSVGSVNEAHQAPLVANLVVAVCLIGLVLYAHKRLDLALAYRVIVPVIVILFAVLPFFWETSPVVLNAVMSACYGTFDVIIWYMVVGLLRLRGFGLRHRRSGARIVNPGAPAGNRHRLSAHARAGKPVVADRWYIGGRSVRACHAGTVLPHASQGHADRGGGRADRKEGGRTCDERTARRAGERAGRRHRPRRAGG